MRLCRPFAGASGCRIHLNVVLMTRTDRPARGEIDAAALELIARHGAQVLATARRYAATPEDAEDAYQRGIEILLTKAPTTREAELIPWLKTVVKHEAFALRRQRDRHSPVTDDGELRDRPGAAVTHEQAERLERLRQGAEALTQLKPHEVRALVLKAEGFSYREICSMTGWSYTKVNRLLTEGRRAFLSRVSGIQRGADCARYEPLISALADGEASAADLERLRPHMRTCLSCRAALREFRAAPERVAGAVAPLVLADESPVRALDSFAAAVQHKIAGLGERAHAAAELATGQKLAAVAASAAALAGGGTALDEYANHRGPPRPASVEQVQREPVKEEVPIEPAPPPPAEAEQPVDPPADPAGAPPPPESAPPPPPPDPAAEFAPSGAVATAEAPPSSAEPAPSGGGGPGSGEFAP